MMLNQEIICNSAPFPYRQPKTKAISVRLIRCNYVYTRKQQQTKETRREEKTLKKDVLLWSFSSTNRLYIQTFFEFKILSLSWVYIRISTIIVPYSSTSSTSPSSPTHTIPYYLSTYFILKSHYFYIIKNILLVIPCDSCDYYGYYCAPSSRDEMREGRDDDSSITRRHKEQ